MIEVYFDSFQNNCQWAKKSIKINLTAHYYFSVFDMLPEPQYYLIITQ